MYQKPRPLHMTGDPQSLQSCTRCPETVARCGPLTGTAPGRISQAARGEWSPRSGFQTRLEDNQSHMLGVTRHFSNVGKAGQPARGPSPLPRPQRRQTLSSHTHFLVPVVFCPARWPPSQAQALAWPLLPVSACGAPISTHNPT